MSSTAPAEILEHAGPDRSGRTRLGIPRPGTGLIRWLATWLVVALAASVWPGVELLFLSSGLALMGMVLVSAVRLARLPLPMVERRVAPSLSLGEWSEVTLRFEAPGDQSLDLEIFDDYPVHAELEGLPCTLHLAAGTTVEQTYRLRPRRRGPADFGRVEVWIRSPGDLLRRRAWVGHPATVRVLPNFRFALQKGLAGIELRLAQLGVHLQRRRGDGLDFKELRDYREGDSLRIVDWKATARRGQLVSRQYQDERNQQIMLLLDCGRRMHAREGDLTHFDHVLDASLMLAWLAGRQGDAVGFQTFAGDERSLPPVHGAQALSRLVDAMYDLSTTSQSPDYPAAAARLMALQRRRALVVLLTNLRDEDSAEMIQAVRSLAQRHLVLVASVRERALRQMSEQRIGRFESALEVASTHLYLQHRHQAHEKLRSEGAFVLDVEPQDLPAALAHRYLEIKRAGRL